MDSNVLTLPIAFIAGFISFISPCVLPLVPAYIGYMGGRLTHSVARTDETAKQRVPSLLHSLFFIGGFTLVFVSLGLLLNAFVTVVGGENVIELTNLIGRLGGILIIIFGLHFMGILPGLLRHLRQNQSVISSPFFSLSLGIIASALLFWGFGGNVLIWESRLWADTAWAPQLGLFAVAGLWVWFFLNGALTDAALFWRRSIDGLLAAFYADTRRMDSMPQQGRRGYAGSAMMGIVFAAGWSPCIGPVYGSILTMATERSGNVTQAGVLLLAYSLGLGLPFLFAALALDQTQSILRRLQRHMHKIELVSGAFLVAIGLLVASGSLQQLSARFGSSELALAATMLEDQVINVLTGQEDNLAPTRVAGESNPIPRPTVAPTVANVNAQQNQAAPPLVDLPVNSSPLGIGSISDLVNAGMATIGTQEGDLAPDFETVTDSGQPLRLSDYRGEIVLVNFWATWCGPCLIEMPEFQAAYEQYQDQGFTVVAVNNLESAAAVRAFREENDLSFPLAMDESGAIQNLYGVQRTYPSSFLLDRDGVILLRRAGILTPDELQAALSELLTA